MTESELRELIAEEILDMNFPQIDRHSRNVKHDMNLIIFEIAMNVREGQSDKVLVP